MIPSPDRSGIVVSTPYREGSIRAIAHAAAGASQLAHLYTTVETSGLLNLIAHVPAARTMPLVERELGRRRWDGLPRRKISTVATMHEAVHTAARRYGRSPGLTQRLMYAVKQHFDRGVARRLQRLDAGIVVGMFAASRDTFRIAKARGASTALNFVNSYPLVHNRLLREYAALSSRHPELVPPSVGQRVDEELALADSVLVPSRFVANQLVAIGIQRDKIIVEPYGVNLDAFHPPAARRERADGKVRCLFVGQISHRKGIPTLLAAARALAHSPLEFLVIGPYVSPEVINRVPANMRVLGPQAHAAIGEAMASADVFVLPSIEDSFGLVATEAMASGLPVLVSDHAGVSEIMTNWHDGVVVPAADATALAAALQRLADEPELRKAIGRAARLRVEDGRSWHSFGVETVRILQERHTAAQRTRRLEPYRPVPA